MVRSRKGPNGIQVGLVRRLLKVLDMSIKPCFRISVLVGFFTCATGCGEEAINQSWQAWLTTKSTCGTYHYSVPRSSFSGRNSKTSIEITAGTATRRTGEQWHFVPGPTSGTKVVDGQWTEVGPAVGTHDGAEPARTMDALYDDCASKVLSQDPTKNDITFKADTRGVLQQCWYVPHDCADDCAVGVIIDEFACGPLPGPTAGSP